MSEIQEQQQVVEEPTVEAPDEDTSDGDEGGQAGEALLKALREERAAVKALKAEIESIRLQGMSEQERAVAEARKAGYDEAMSEATRELLATQARAAAASAGFADPSDIERLLDLDGLKSQAEVARAVEALAKSKPYLLRKTMQVEQGPRGASANPDASVSDDWLRRAARR